MELRARLRSVRRSPEMRPRPHQTIRLPILPAWCPSLTRDAASAAGRWLARRAAPHGGPSLPRDAASAAITTEYVTTTDAACPSLTRDAASAASTLAVDAGQSADGVRRSPEMRPRPRCFRPRCACQVVRVRRSPEMRPRPLPQSSDLRADAYMVSVAHQRCGLGRPYPLGGTGTPGLPVSVAHQRCGLGRRIPITNGGQPLRCPSLTRDAASAARPLHGRKERVLD